ncbi:MAG: NAD regulator [Hyphomicrobiaceae bacterium]|nr:NAD regulator [Hyphomicrobiaceae bacterium]MCC0008894.1 NAD regulator [Hyphomicrobiaceae bacterium]
MRREPLSRKDVPSVEIGLNAAIASVHNDEPVVLIVKETADSVGASDSLPSGPFSPRQHRTLEIGLRSWVREQTGLDFGYVEQLYTFGDRGRHARAEDRDPHVVSIGYLALTHTDSADDLQRGSWHSWYEYFPWEDWRRGRPSILETTVLPRLKAWAQMPQMHEAPSRPIDRSERVRMCFGAEGGAWDEEKVLDRYELLYEAGLVDEAQRDRPEFAVANSGGPQFGTPMIFDHRRILATAISRVRAKIKYRPVIFELMPQEFTLYELQKTVEAILGPHLHKQNFRRLVESAGLVEPTGQVKTRTGGRPAKLFRFRREVVLERPAPGVRVKPGRQL